MANLRRPTWDCQIWILGMWTVPYPVLILAQPQKIIQVLHQTSISNNKYKYCINNLYFIPLLDYSRQSQKYIKPPIYPLTLIPG